MNSKQKRGFITIAVGDYYRYLAKNLAITYHMNGESEKPIAIVTDTTDPEIEKLFDIVILENEPIESGYLYKLKLHKYTPFEETIFLDADQFIIDKLDPFWQLFNDVDFGVIGINSKSIKGAKNFFSLEKVIEKFGIDEVPKFQGGIYYFKNNESAVKVFTDAIIFSDDYDFFEMPRFVNAENLVGSKGDEPLISLAMAVNKHEAILDPWKRTGYNLNKTKGLDLNILKRKCTYLKSKKRIYPTIVHFGTDRTKMYHYKREAFKIKMAYYKGIPGWLSNLFLVPYTMWYASKCIAWQVLTLYRYNGFELLPIKDPWFGIIRKIKKRI